MRMALAVTFAVVAASVAGCAASSADNAATGPVESKPVATISSAAVSQPPPCSAAVSNWDAISLPFEPAPASAENSVAQTMLKLRKATKAGNELLVETLGSGWRRILWRCFTMTCLQGVRPGLRRDVRRQMTFAGLAGVGMSLGNFSTATGAMKLAVAYQRQVMAEEDKITGSNNGGW